MRPEVASDLASEFDRLALCVHQPASRRPELMAALAPLGLPRQSLAVVAARFLAAGRVSIADRRSMAKYQTDGETSTIVDAHVRRGLLVPIDDAAAGFTPTTPLQAGASVVLGVQAEEADRLWSSGDLTVLRRHAERHVEVALRSPRNLDAFHRQVGVYHPVPESDAGQLLGRITELRYLRSDIHAACLADEGLSGPSARILHRLWRGSGREEEVDESLIERGLVQVGADGAVTTEQGVATCESVEHATNAEFADVFRSLSDDLSTALLDEMRTLAGEDPRPENDR